MNSSGGLSTIFDITVDINPYDSSAFSHRRMDEGPVLNRIGRLALLLHRLGLKSPDGIFLGTAPKFKYHEKVFKTR